MKDLRGNRVFPRLAYAVLGQTIDRRARQFYQFLVRRPINRVTQFVATWNDHEKTAEIFLAGFALFIAFIRAITLLALAIATLYLAVARL